MSVLVSPLLGGKLLKDRVRSSFSLNLQPEAQGLQQAQCPSLSCVLDPRLLRPCRRPTSDFSVNQPIVHSDVMSEILWLCLSSPPPQGPSRLVPRCHFTAQFTGPRGVAPCLGINSEGDPGLPGPGHPPQKVAATGFLELESRGKQAKDLGSSCFCDGDHLKCFSKL